MNTPAPPGAACHVTGGIPLQFEWGPTPSPQLAFQALAASQGPQKPAVEVWGAAAAVQK